MISDTTPIDAAMSFHKFMIEFFKHLKHNNFPPVIGLKRGSEVLVGTVSIETGKSYATVQQAVLGMDFIPESIVFTADAYGAVVNSPEELVKHVPLEKRKKEGDKEVSEMIITTYLSDGYSISISQPYEYCAETGQFKWLEVTTSEVTDWDFNRIINGQPRLDINNNPICPMCDEYIPNNNEPGKYPGALSRQDNKTEICSACGLAEAMNGLLRKY